MPSETLQVRDDYFDFKRQVRRRESPNREWHQSVARDLADDEVGGPDFIQRTIKLCTTLGADGNCLKLARTFLKVITHQSMLRSLSIDSFLGTIYRMVGGSNGDRGIVFFSDLNRRLSGSSESPRSFLALVVLSLYELFRRERKGLLNDALSCLLDALREKAVQLASLAQEPGPDSVDLDAVGMQIDIIRRMMNGARGGLSEDETAQAITVGNTRAIGIQSTFPSEVVVPGGKHDNDFADITKIQIFPTLGEITCDVSEYLPTTDFTQPHFFRDPVQRHIDSAFRLLRHDIFGPLKQVIGALLAQRNAADAVSSNRFITGNIKAHIYSGASVQHVLVDKRDGFEAIASFTKPPQVRKLTLPDQQRWWQASSRLEPGGLVCFVSTRGNEKSFLMFVVTEKNTAEIKEGQNKSTLVSDRFKPAVKVKLASETRENLAMLNRMYVDGEEGLLVELPGLIPDTFVPILENLQRMKDGDLAFRRWILPSTDDGDGQPSARVPPPAYARKPGFRFRLRTITRDGQPTLSINPAECTGDIATTETLEAATGLDPGQSVSLIAALTREYALIQGPPGTGKSYVGVQLVRVLLDHKHEANLGPILVICYTNHALDQFLKHLLDVGIHKIIRIGGQSRAEELEGKNLRVFSSQCLDKDGFKLADGRDPVQLWLGKQQNQAALGRHNDDGRSDRVDLVSRAENNISSLTPAERWALAGSWISELTELQSDRIFEMISAAKDHREAIQRVHDDVNCRTLLRADVVGVTTTGLARNINMLCRLGVKVIICEEAAEVMEPHLISALMPGVEHFIQIGDHRQLRPQIQNYLQFSMETAVGRAYQLDRSQFERRAVGEPGLRALPVAQLKVQRRMRPEISQLIRRVYPDLVDHDCVKNLPSVVGMRDNLFWLDHDHPEDAKDDGARAKSHSNPWEVSMVKALIHHLVRQGEYKSTDIALLTPYTGQLQKLRASLSSDFEVFLSDRDLETLAKEGFEATQEEEQGTENGSRKVVEKKRLLQTIRLATVDNFQGEEAKVVVVSLVRSNSNAKVGFLRTENRINVLLSRAQHGMYLIGNAKTYENVPMWADVLQQLRARNAVGTSIALCCPRHPETPLLCSEPKDFTIKSPEGGCSLTCDKRLEPCGHRCPAPCHSQRLHDAFDCLEPCPRLRSTCQHPCPKLCGQEPVMKGRVAAPARKDVRDARVDLMEFKMYDEIDLDETPIVILGCGHFFTGETLDGLVCMNNVYTTDNLGNYNGLRELSGELMSIPTCPDCRVPIRQFATRRYNRVVNKAVLDETSKRFLVGGREKLAELEKKVALVEKKLSDSRDTTYTPDVFLGKKISERYKPAVQLEKESAALRKSMEAEHQPTKKLFDAVLTFQRLQRERSLEEKLQDLTLSEPQITTPKLVVYDRQITLKAHRLELRLQEAMLRDTFILLSRLKNSAILTNIPVQHPDKRSARFLKQCRDLIDSATSAKLPRLVIETILSYARVAELDGWYRRAFMFETVAPTDNTGTTTTNNTAAPLTSDAGGGSERTSNVQAGEKTSRETAIGLLDRALGLCATIPGPDGDAYRTEVEETMRLFSEPHYEEVTPAEIAAIKAAMVRGAGGLATHSGHWYTCRNGHPFAIGECGMPMERARCPECGEVIGGTNHTPVEGVQRDMRMELA
ncbi:hypothetical protein VTG60DRAFT_334 [Thermothelomyces hinnuleus]